MVSAFDEGQAGDDLRRACEFERGPPWAGAGDGKSRNEAEVAFDSVTASTTVAAPICGTNGTVKPK